MTQELTERDYPHHVEFSRRLFTSDRVNLDLRATECSFTRKGAFNSHNQHLWASINSHAHHRRFSNNL